MSTTDHSTTAGKAVRFLKNNAAFLFTVITVLCMLVVCIYINHSFTLENSPFLFAANKNARELAAADMEVERNGEWHSAVSLAYGNGLHVNGETRLRCKIPEQLDEQNALSFANVGTAVTVYLDGMEVCRSAVSTHLPFGRYFGSEWLVVELTPNDAGKYLYFEMSEGSNGILRDFLLSRQAALVQQAWTSSLPRLLMLVVFLLFFIVEGFYLLASRLRAPKKHFYLSGFLFILSLWLFTESHLANFLFENRAVVYYLSAFFFSLLPLSLCLFCQESFPWAGKWFGGFCLLFSVFFFTAVGFVLSDTAELSTFLPLVFGELLLTLVIGLILCIKHREEDGFHASGILFVIAIFTAVSGFFAYYSLWFERSVYGNIVLIGAWGIWCVGMFSRAANARKAMTDAHLLGYYKKMAYTDYLTGLHNKAAYDRDLPLIDKKSPALAVIMLDSNNLKEINDCHGHDCGDKLLRSTAYCLATAFGEHNPVYRVGGDEFIVLIPANAEEDIQELLTKKLNKFNELVVRNNENSEWKISVAYGYALRQAGEPITAAAMAKNAESIMYRNKREGKQQKSHT